MPWRDWSTSSGKVFTHVRVEFYYAVKGGPHPRHRKPTGQRVGASQTSGSPRILPVALSETWRKEGKRMCGTVDSVPCIFFLRPDKTYRVTLTRGEPGPEASRYG